MKQTFNDIKTQAGVYIFTNKINNKKYIGESIDIRDRIMRYKYPKPVRPFEHALIKYGFDGFDLEIVYYPYFNKTELLETERLLIEEYDSLVPYGYNICRKGTDQTGKSHSVETKHKLSEANKGKIHSDETRKKISQSNKGKTFSEESKKKISFSNTGKTRSEEAKKKMSDAKKGKPRSEEVKKI